MARQTTYRTRKRIKGGKPRAGSRTQNPQRLEQNLMSKEGEHLRKAFSHPAAGPRQAAGINDKSLQKYAL